jgi:PAT family beta-lactamase induction signal transducer AmpG
MAAVVAGYLFTQQVAQPLAAALLAPLWEGGTVTPALRTRWADLLALLAGLALTLPLAGWAARRARFETLLGGLRGYFSQPQAGLVLAFIVAYKLGDAFAGTLLTPFLLKGVGYASAEVGVVNKVLGLWLSIGGALLGGVLMMRLGLWRALLLFGLLQAASNLGFWWLAVHGRGQLPGLVLPAFDWGFVALAQATPVDGGLLAVIALENLTGGMGTAAFLALLMSLTQQRFSATQFAMLSAFASVGRVWVGPLAGVLAESLGWPTFFIVSLLMAVPGLLLLLPMRATLQRIAPSADTARDD